VDRTRAAWAEEGTAETWVAISGCGGGGDGIVGLGGLGHLGP